MAQIHYKHRECGMVAFVGFQIVGRSPLFVWSVWPGNTNWKGVKYCPLVVRSMWLVINSCTLGL